MSHYFWNAEVVVPGAGRHDAQGAHRSARPVTEKQLKAAVARDVAAKHNCAANDLYIFNFNYTDSAA